MKIKILILVVLVFRMFLSLLPPMEIDHSAWRAWSARLVELSPAHFYSREFFTDNPPGWLYMFWFLGEVKNTFFQQVSFWSAGYDWMLKLPNNLADIASGWLIYTIIKKRRGEKWASRGFLLYTLNPVTWFNSAVFGQFDGSGAFLGLLAFYLLLEKKNLAAAVASMALAWTVKPQAAALLPAFGLLILVTRKFKDWLLAAAIFLVATGLIYWPFFPANPLAGWVYVFRQMSRLYTCTSCFTFNFWGLWGNWQTDTKMLFGLPLLFWGMILTGLIFSLIFLGRSIRARFKPPYIYYTTALSIMTFNMLLTRMHERYVFPFFAFFLLAAVLMRSRLLLIIFVFYSLLNVFNVYYAYAYYNSQLQLTPSLIAWVNLHFNQLSLLGFLVFLFLLSHFVLTLKKVK